MFHNIKRTHRLPWRRLTIGAIIALIAVSLLVWQWPQVMGVGHREPSPTPTQGERRPAPIALSLRERDYLSQLGPITVCPDPNWPPYEQVDAEGHFTGITADLLDLIAARLGIEFTYVIARDWSETVALSQAGEVLILPFLNQTPSREEWLVFTEPLLTDVAVFVTREEHPFITDAAELTDRTIVLPPGTSVEERVRRDFPNLTIMRVASEIDAFTAVSNREADMTLRSLTVAAYTIRREGLFNLKIAGQAPDPYLNRLRMGVLKDEPLLRDILNKGIATITPREREEIINRHVNITVVQPVDYGLIFRVAAVLVGLMGAAFYMNIRLSKVNAALRESERSKAVLLANLPGMAYRCHYDRQWTMEFVSEGCLALTGYHSEDLLDNRLVAYNDVIVPEDRERVWESWQQAAEAQHPALLEYRIVTAGGEEKWVYERGIIVDNGHDGTPRIEGLIIDITERKRAEEALIRYQEHLEDLVLGRTAEIQAQYAESVAILRSVGDAICMTDPDRRIVYVNPAFTRLTGYTADEALGREMQKMEVFENLEVRVPAMMATLREGESWEGEMSVRRKDGRRYDAALTLAPVHDDAGQISGIVFTHQDISRIKDLERARAQFIANVSHQFRTPLALLKSSLYLLLRTDPSEPQRRQLQTIDASTTWLTQLVEDILETLALDSGKGAEVWAPVSVTEVIRAVQDRYQHQAQAAELTLEAVSVPDLPLTYGDEARLTQALGELVENAVVFTPPGGRVTIRTDLEDDRWITVAVEDTGPGMPEEDMGHLFERFFRGHLAESGHTAGVGLGLPIARQIAEAHGGEITVRSTEGRGSIFTLRLRAVAS